MPVHSAFLKYFDEVCKSGSIRKAANKLFVASSAVNRQILKIEDELETKLFERSHEGIKLTETGRLLAQHVSRTLSDAERTFQEIEACKENKLKGITIVGQESVIARFLPPSLVTLHAEFPNVATSFVAASGRNLNQLLMNGSADIALIFDPQEEAQIEQISTIRLPVGAVMAPSHPLSKRTHVSVRECAEYALILPDESWPLRDILDRELRGVDIDPDTVTTSNSVEFLRAMLAKELVIGFQTIIGIELAVEEGSLVHIPLWSDDNQRLIQAFSVCINRNRQKSPVVESILPLLQQRLLNYG